ncbi:MAG: hypothetical protein GQ561_03070 [Calditrichae bacterium]|nr:hypothetical protein [Calditrichia bacterium]
MEHRACHPVLISRNMSRDTGRRRALRPSVNARHKIVAGQAHSQRDASGKSALSTKINVKI